MLDVAENIWTSERKIIMENSTKDELEAIIKGQNIVRFIKCQRIRWLGHIERIQDTAIPKKDAVRKAVCNKTKRKTKNEMVGLRVHGPEKDGYKRMER